MSEGVWTFRLFVVGETGPSGLAVANARRILDDRLGPDGYELEVVDLRRDPAAAETFDLIATPTMVRTSPAPQEMLIGDLSAPYVPDLLVPRIG